MVILHAIWLFRDVPDTSRDEDVPLYAMQKICAHSAISFLQLSLAHKAILFTILSLKPHCDHSINTIRFLLFLEVFIQPLL